MTSSKLGRLLALTAREYSRTTPARKRFKARNVNLKTFDEDWDRQRGAAARMMAVILREDSESLYEKIGADPETASTYSDAVSWLTKEAVYARKHAGRLELAAARLNSAVARHGEAVASAGGASGASVGVSHASA